MKFKNLKVNDDVKFYLCEIAIIGLCCISGVSYYSYEKQIQLVECETNDLDTFVNENGQICCNFDEGQHKIKVSRNDAYYHQINSVDGYSIESVDVNGWRDNNQVIYVNAEPVTVVGTKQKDGTVTFDNFGNVITNSLDSITK